MQYTSATLVTGTLFAPTLTKVANEFVQADESSARRCADYK